VTDKTSGRYSRGSLRFASWKDLKAVYTAYTEEDGQLALTDFNDIWGKKYPNITVYGTNHWVELSTFFKYPNSVRKLIYTTNPIKSLNATIKRKTKAKGAFPNESSLIKLLYMGIQNASKKWTMPVWNWSLTLSQLAIFFEGRLDKHLKV